MSLLSANKPTIDVVGAANVKLLHQMECKACPLNFTEGKLLPTGTPSPLVYILGEAAGCVSGDTLIDTAFRDKSLHPGGVPIQELVGKSDFYVYSFDTAARKLALGRVRKVWKTGQKPVFRVRFFWWGGRADGGGGRQRYEGYIDVTDNHPFLLKNGAYASLREGLAVGARLEPFYRSNKQRSYVGTAGAPLRPEARVLLELELGRSLLLSENVHHCDENPLNDLRANLQVLTVEEHARVHCTANLARGEGLWGDGAQSASREAQLTPEYRKLQRERQLEYLSIPDNYEQRKVQVIAAGMRTRIGPNNRPDTGVKGCIWVTDGKKDLFHRASEPLPEGFREGRSKVSDWKSLRWITDGETSRRVPVDSQLPTGWRFGRTRRLARNHKVYAIELVGVVDVFDMEVERYHNFAANGVFVHNSQEIEEREQFVGQSGQLLRSHIPRSYRDKLRFNNAARCRPPHNATPTPRIIECCRPSVQKDIERTKPKAIFGFGNVPLEWASGYSGVTMWRGRRMPVQIGTHTCWYYPMLHPAYLLRNRKKGRPGIEEHIFGLDIQRALKEVESLPTPYVHTAADVTRNTELITGHEGPKDVQRVFEALSWAVEQPLIGWDYETNCLRPYSAGSKILSAAVATGERAVSIALQHPEAGWQPKELREVEELWLDFLKSPVQKVAHNLAFELEWSCNKFSEDLLLGGNWGDTFTQAFTIDERSGNKRGGAGPLSLEFLVQQYFGFNLKKLFGVDRKNLENTPLETVLVYNAPDARYAALLYEQQAKTITARKLQEPYKLALRSIPAVVSMQLRGLPVDQKEVKRLTKKYDKEFDTAFEDLAKLAPVKEFERRKGETFKPLSNPNVLYVLKDVMHRKEVLVVDKYTKKEKYSADEKVLEQIDHPFAEKLIKLRKINKQRSTYIAPLDVTAPDNLVYPDGLIHGQFNTGFAETGRLSAEGPNLQNFPKRGTVAKEVRKQIVAPPGCVILAFDYGQIEARVIAAATQDKAFCKALWERYDIHQEWAERIARAYPSRVGGKKNLTDKGAMKAFRTDVKNQWTFPLFFGARLESVGGYLHIPPEVLKPLYNEFWRQFSGGKRWQEEQMRLYEERGYVECLTGKRRHGPLTTNQILNSPIQGTAAAMVIEALSRLVETGDPELRPEIQIHDDITFARVPANRQEQIAEKILDELLRPIFPWFNVPLTVEGAVGSDWLNMEEFGVFSSDEWGY